jgi:hypothetical protein
MTRNVRTGDLGSAWTSPSEFGAFIEPGFLIKLAEGVLVPLDPGVEPTDLPS